MNCSLCLDLGCWLVGRWEKNWARVICQSRKAWLYLRAIPNVFCFKPGNERILNSSATNSGLGIVIVNVNNQEIIKWAFWLNHLQSCTARLLRDRDDDKRWALRCEPRYPASCSHVAERVASAPSDNGKKSKPSQCLGADRPSWLLIASFALLYCTDRRKLEDFLP